MERLSGQTRQRWLGALLALIWLLSAGLPVSAVNISAPSAAHESSPERLQPAAFAQITTAPGASDWQLFLPVITNGQPAPGLLLYRSPRVAQDLEYTNEGVWATFSLTNDTGRAVSRFELTYTVLSDDPSLAALEQSSSSAAFSAQAGAAPGGIAFRFQLQPGQNWPANGQVFFTAHFRLAQGASFSDQVDVAPRPFPAADANYNQINDDLEQSAARLLAAGGGQAADQPLPVIVALGHPASEADLQVFRQAGGAVDVVFAGEGFASFAGSLPPAGVQAYVAAAGESLVFLDPDAETSLFLDVATTNSRVANVWTGALTGNNRADPLYAYQGDNQTAIAFIDTGIDDAHPALGPFQDVGAAGWGGLAGATKLVGWQDYNQPPAAAPVDLDGHGSHVGGIIAGTAGGVNPSGVARNARLVALRATGRVQRSIAALRWLRANRRAYHVVALSSSQGVAGKNIPNWDEEMRLTFQDGIPIAQAAGNEFDSFNNLGLAIGTPGVSPYVLTVGAVNDQNQISFFSSQGHPQFAAFGLIKPDVVAPGGTYVSLRRTIDQTGVTPAGHVTGTAAGVEFLANGNAIRSADSNDRPLRVPAVADLAPNANDTIEMAGTSMAAPHVAGQMGLMVDAMTEYGGADGDGQGGNDEDPWNGADDDRDDIIDEDVGPWNERSGAEQAQADREKNARLLKSVAAMATFELTAGERVPRWAVGPLLDVIDDQNLNTQRDAGEPTLTRYLRSAVGGDVVWDVNGNNAYNQGTDVLLNFGGGWAPGTANGEALNPIDSPAAGPFNKLFDNAGTVNNPPAVSRGGKDVVEGYGMVAADAALEALTKEFCAVETDSFGAGTSDKKVWARHVHLYAGKEYKALLDVPGGGDFDLYVYYGSVAPDRVRMPNSERDWQRGEPIILAKSVAAGNGADEEITFQAPQDGLYFLVVRWVSGAGEFTVRLITPEEWTIMVYMAGELEGNASLDDLLFEALNDMEQTGSGEESMKDFQVVALADYDQRAYDGKDGPPPANEPDHRGDAVLYCIRKDHKTDQNQYSIAKQPADVLALADAGLATQNADANMGNPETLGKLAAWAVDYFPAKKYAFVLWGDGRGYGWKANPKKALGPGSDTKRAPRAQADAEKDALTMKRLKRAVKLVKDEINAGSQYKDGTGVDKKIDLLGFDIGHMALIEVGKQVQESVEVMVASEERIHERGWPYKEVLEGLKCERDGAGWKNCHAQTWGAEEFGKHMVSVYHTYYTTATVDSKHTLSAVRLNPKPGQRAGQIAEQEPEAPATVATFDQLVSMVSSFGAEMKIGIEDYLAEDDPTDNVQIKIKHEGREGSEEMEDHNYIDLRHFARRVRDSSVPRAYKTQADPIYQALEKDGGVILASEHGPAHPEAHGLTIYYPHDQLLPEDANCKDAPDRGDRTCGFDNPLPSKEIYAKDALILAPILRQPAASATHPHPQIEDFRFPEETAWDEFLHRYYKPVADACIRLGSACVKSAIIFVGQRVTLSGLGSSDSDGPARDDIPDDWYWDFDLTRDHPAPDPVYPVTSTIPIDTVCSEDCDRDSPMPANETDDDPDAIGRLAPWTCRAPGRYDFRLMVHDEHNDQNRVHDDETHYVHWKVDDDQVTILCIQLPWTPIKTPDRTTAPPGQHVVYTLALHNLDSAAQTLSGSDALPDSIVLQPSSLTCSAGECSYDPAAGVVNWNVTLAPETMATLVYDTITEVPPECPPSEPPTEPPPERTNRFTVVDLAGNSQVAESTVQIPCPPPANADLSIVLTAAPNPAPVGGNLAYHLEVLNNGPAAASQVILTDLLPAGVILLNVQASQGQCAGQPQIVCQLGSLQAGDMATLDLLVLLQPSVPPGATLVNQAQVTAQTPDPDPGNNQATVTVAVRGE